VAEELQAIYGEPAPNLLYWRNAIVEVIDDLVRHPTERPAQPDELSETSLHS